MIILIEFFFLLSVPVICIGCIAKIHGAPAPKEENKLGSYNQMALARYEEMTKQIKNTYGEEAWTQAITGALKDTNNLVLEKLESPLNSKNYHTVSRIIKNMGELIEKKEESTLDEELELELELLKNVMAKKFSRKEVKK